MKPLATALPKPAKIVLVTGFAPFGGEAINPSWEIVRALPEKIAGFQIVKLRVPTEFGKSITAATKAITTLQPAIVLCLGQAGSRSRMSVERVAINVNDAVIADNAHQQPIDEAIFVGAPAAYFATLPIKSMVAAMSRKGVPAEVSNTAGTFVCNHLLYGVLHHIAVKNLAARAGFMHVPFVESQIVDRPNTASLSLATMIVGVEAAITTAVKHQRDVKRVGGALH